MTKNTFCFLAIALAAHSSINAGILDGGKWSLTRCGDKPEAPAIDQTDVAAFNQSIAKINAWQQQAKVYYECLVNEANTDNAIIADTANAAQAEYRATVESIGSTAPFVGLFGTVLGIMHAQHEISQSGSASLGVVAGPICDALIATAVGIAVAVPAVLAYNFFGRRARQHRQALDHFAGSFLHLVFNDGNQE